VEMRRLWKDGALLMKDREQLQAELKRLRGLYSDLTEFRNQVLKQMSEVDRELRSTGCLHKRGRITYGKRRQATRTCQDCGEEQQLLDPRECDHARQKEIQLSIGDTELFCLDCGRRKTHRTTRW